MKSLNEEAWYSKAIRAIYRQKIIIVALVLLIGVIGSLYFHHLGEADPNYGYLKKVPLKELGDACLIALVVGFAYEWIVRKEAEEKLEELFRRRLLETEKNILTNIPKSFLADKKYLKNTYSKETIDKIIQNSLQVRCDDDEYGEFLFNGLLNKTFDHKERWYNYRCKVTLSEVSDEENISHQVKDVYYQATVDLRYDAILGKDIFRFACVSSIDKFNELIKDPSYQETWLFPPSKLFPQINSSVYNVLYVKVGGIDLDVQGKSIAENLFLYEAKHEGLSNKIGSLVPVHYRYEVKLDKIGHLLMVCLIYPTKGVSIEVDFAETDVHYMNVNEFFVATENPIIRYSPSQKKPHKIEVELSEWLFPKGGVSFVWSTKPEKKLLTSIEEPVAIIPEMVLATIPATEHLEVAQIEKSINNGEEHNVH